MSGTVQEHLANRFDENRVVFWQDPDGQYGDDLDALISETPALAGVEILRVANNEFGVKNTILSNTGTRFLVYRTGETPRGASNWLLDLELAYGVFSADKLSMLSQELGITDPALVAIMEDKKKFFGAKSRSEALRSLLAVDDDPRRFQAKMCQVVVKSAGHSLSQIVPALLEECAEGSDAKIQALETYGLTDFLWQGLADIYRYEDDNPSIRGFVLWMFNLAYREFEPESGDLYRNIRSDFDSWANNVRMREVVKILGEWAAGELVLAERIAQVEDYRTLEGNLVFEAADRTIISALAREIPQRLISARDVDAIVKQRADGLWYPQYQHCYEALSHAAHLVQLFQTVPDHIASLDEGLRDYVSSGFRVDQYYRKFVTAYRSAEHKQPLEDLKIEIDKRYANDYLYKFGAAWQTALDSVKEWRSVELAPQATFYKKYVEPLAKNAKVVVIISDGMRYEIADELADRIHSMDRYEASIDAVLGSVPSYTQLGMASLLPHDTLEIVKKGNLVKADDQPTDNTKNRSLILEKVSGKALAFQELEAKTKQDLREYVTNSQVIYVYHNLIDNSGEHFPSERKVFDAAQQAIEEILYLIRRWASANISNILITADHGFLYQDLALEDHFYVSEKPQGDRIEGSKDRFTLGHQLKKSKSFMTFTAADLGLEGDLEVQIPRSILRLRTAGAGDRYVHGGASLQEIVVPVVSVKKKRTSDVSLVEVDINPTTDRITTGQLTVQMRQQDAVTAKVHARQLRAGIWAGEKVLSALKEVTFDCTSDDPRELLQSVRLSLNNDATAYNGQQVEFRLEEPIDGTSQWKLYKQASYKLQLAAYTDGFDF